MVGVVNHCSPAELRWGNMSTRALQHGSVCRRCTGRTANIFRNLKLIDGTTFAYDIVMFDRYPAISFLGDQLCYSSTWLPSSHGAYDSES